MDTPVPPEPAPADWLTVEQAMRAYRRSERTIRRQLGTGELEGVQVKGPRGKEWRIRPPPSDMDDWPHPPGARPAAEAPPGQALLRLNEVEQLLAPILTERDTLRDEVARLQEQRLADLRASEEARRAESNAAERRIGELEGRLTALEAELERRSAVIPQQSTAAAPGATPPALAVAATITHKRAPKNRFSYWVVSRPKGADFLGLLGPGLARFEKRPNA